MRDKLSGVILSSVSDEWNSWPDTRFCYWCYNVQSLWVFNEWDEIGCKFYSYW